MGMSSHIVKFEYVDGVKLDSPILWCERKSNRLTWYFEDAQHAALSVNGVIQPCKNCIKRIINELSKAI